MMQSSMPTPSDQIREAFPGLLAQQTCNHLIKTGKINLEELESDIQVYAGGHNKIQVKTALAEVNGQGSRRPGWVSSLVLESKETEKVASAASWG